MHLDNNHTYKMGSCDALCCDVTKRWYKLCCSLNHFFHCFRLPHAIKGNGKAEWATSWWVTCSLEHDYTISKQRNAHSLILVDCSKKKDFVSQPWHWLTKKKKKKTLHIFGGKLYDFVNFLYPEIRAEWGWIINPTALDQRGTGRQNGESGK